MPSKLPSKLDKKICGSPGITDTKMKSPVILVNKNCQKNFCCYQSIDVKFGRCIRSIATGTPTKHGLTD